MVLGGVNSKALEISKGRASVLLVPNQSGADHLTGRAFKALALCSLSSPWLDAGGGLASLSPSASPHSPPALLAVLTWLLKLQPWGRKPNMRKWFRALAPREAVASRGMGGVLPDGFPKKPKL